MAADTTSICMLLLLSGTIGTGECFNYTDTRVIREKLILYDNPRFDLETVGTGDDAVLYMRINEPIWDKDNLRMSVAATRNDGIEFPIPSNPIRLCDLLSEEANNTNHQLTQFHLSRIFNFEGLTCPIPSGKKRLMPYMFPPMLSLQNDIGCGTFTYTATIESCQEQEPEDCIPFITANTDVFLSGDHCSNTLT